MVTFRHEKQVSAETSVQNPVPQVTREYRSHVPARTVQQRHQGADELYRGSLDLSSIQTADEKTVHNIVEHGPPLRFTRREMAAGENLLAHMSDAISPHPPAASSRLASAQLQSSAAAALAAAAAHDAVVNARTATTAAVPESDSKHAAIAPHIAHRQDGRKPRTLLRARPGPTAPECARTRGMGENSVACRGMCLCGVVCVSGRICACRHVFVSSCGGSWKFSSCQGKEC
jgi:hypothetical protein